MENSVTNDKTMSSKSTKNSTNDEFCDENHVNKSKTLSCGKILTSNQIHYRPTTLSDYFPMQEIEKSRDEESKSADIMVDFRKLVSQLLNAKVVIEKLPQSAIKSESHPTLRINIERMQLNTHQPSETEDTKKCTLRYCHKCKTSNFDYKRTSVRRKCHKCGSDLLFVCDKCYGNLYPRHGHMERHRNLCDGQKKSDSQGLTSIQFYYCADCEFFTAYESSMKLHVSMTQHKVLGRK